VVALYDTAIAAVAEAGAARWGGTHHVQPEAFPALAHEKEKIERELDRESMQRWVDAKHAARSALAALHPYAPDLKRYWDRSEPVADAEFDELMSMLSARRKRLLEGSRGVRSYRRLELTLRSYE